MLIALSGNIGQLVRSRQVDSGGLSESLLHSALEFIIADTLRETPWKISTKLLWSCATTSAAAARVIAPTPSPRLFSSCANIVLLMMLSKLLYLHSSLTVKFPDNFCTGRKGLWDFACLRPYVNVIYLGEQFAWTVSHFKINNPSCIIENPVLSFSSLSLLGAAVHGTLRVTYFDPWKMSFVAN